MDKSITKETVIQEISNMWLKELNCYQSTASLFEDQKVSDSQFMP